MANLPPLSLLITRHGKKDKSKKVIPGSEDDSKVDLSWEGKVECYEQGKGAIQAYPAHDHVHVVTSDFLRARRTSEKMLEGANYSIDDSGLVTTVVRSDIGLGGGIDWIAEEMPNFKEKSEDECVAYLLENFYRPRAGRPELPSVARFAAAMLDALIDGIEAELERGSRSGLVQISTHAPVIDSFAGGISMYPVVFPDGTTALHDFPGAFKMGEYIKGAVIHKSGDDSLVNFYVKGNQTGYTLGQLKRNRDEHQEWAEKPM